MRGEEGQVGGVEGVIFGVLVFVLGTLVIVNAWGVIDAKLAATGAAREAARAFVEAPTATGAAARAQAAAAEAITAQGRHAARMQPVDLGGATLTRCARVTAVVRYDVPVQAIPLLRAATTTFTVSARHSEVVDPYRSGQLLGTAQC